MNDTERDRILRAFDELFLKSLKMNDEAARGYLADEGIDPDKEAEYGERVAKRIAFMMKGARQKEKDANLLATAMELLRTKFAENADRTGQVLQQLLQSKRPLVQHRKLSEWTDEQVRSVLNDVDVVELMEALERGESKP